MEKINYPSYSDLSGKSVLITGGGSGIGAAFVEAFVLQGSRVAFLDIQNEVSQELVQSLSGKGPEPIYLDCDVTDIAALKDAIQQVEEELGAVRVLINNAANDERHAIDDVTEEYWNERMNVNLRHYFFTVQSVKKAMIKNKGGAIVNIGSASWMIGQMI